MQGTVLLSRGLLFVVVPLVGLLTVSLSKNTSTVDQNPTFATKMHAPSVLKAIGLFAVLVRRFHFGERISFVHQLTRASTLGVRLAHDPERRIATRQARGARVQRGARSLHQ